MRIDDFSTRAVITAATNPNTYKPNSAAAPQVRPLDNVVLTGQNSTAGTPGRTIVIYQWEIVSRPTGSTVALTSLAWTL